MNNNSLDAKERRKEMKKKLLCMFVVFAMALVTCFPAAADNSIGTVPASIRALAYSDLESADSVTQQKILDAREQVIFSQSWVVEGRAYVTDAEGNIIRESPQFYDIFPEEWDVPVMDVDSTNQHQVLMKTGQRRADVHELVNGTYLVPMASDIVDAGVVDDYYTSYTSYGSVRSTYDYIDARGYMFYPQPWTINIGYTDLSTGRSLAYEVNLSHQQNYRYCDPPENTHVGVRLSTYDHSTNWNVVIYGYSDGMAG